VIALSFLVEISTRLLPAVEVEVFALLLRVEDQHPLVDDVDDVPEVGT